MKENTEKYDVIFHLNSGQIFVITFSKEKLEEMCNTIKESWGSCCIVCDEWGINFDQVTHYTVKRID